MAKKEKTPKAAGAPKKKRFYHTLVDAYKVVKRTYSWEQELVPQLWPQP